MAFDGLHIVWATHNYWRPQNGQGIWRDLRSFYVQLAQSGHYCELSETLPESASKITNLLNGSVVLTVDQVDDVTTYLAQLIASDGDRLVAGLPVAHYVVRPMCVQMLIVPALSEHSQVIGRIKSKTSSSLCWALTPETQRRIWSSGYWFANINGEVALSKVEKFIRYQNQIDC
jgi:hypothetical protein